ncbi:unnamed protein product [Penicillium olsonii]|nr:unnamed protein product [Penicillium olsonii]CAG7934382.1 unnamed protein product [Penicillium olsonii]
MNSWDPYAITEDPNVTFIVPREPSAWQRFKRQPFLFLALKLYKYRRIVLPLPPKKPVSVTCISNTYYQSPKIPEGDVLIHAGDLTPDGSLAFFQKTLDWLNEQPHPIKIVVGGMNDQLLDRTKGKGRGWDRGDCDKIDWGDIVYLENSGTTITAPNGRRLRVWGSPNSPIRDGKLGFQYRRDDYFWCEKIPQAVDILVTHTPPYGHLDSCIGCYWLLNELWENPPRLHVFGRAEENHGTEILQYDELQSAVEYIIGREKGPSQFWEVVKGFVLSWCRPSTGPRTLLVNACITGGFWNLKRREPITVII